jgi:hypothetical protein
MFATIAVLAASNRSYRRTRYERSDFAAIPRISRRGARASTSSTHESIDRTLTLEDHQCDVRHSVVSVRAWSMLSRRRPALAGPRSR